MREWGIHNYQPHWNTSATELLSLLLKVPLAGLQVQAISSLWDSERDRWLNDAPVVISTQKHQLEFCATRLCDFSFSLNSIDLSVPVYWCEYEDYETKPLHWVRQRNTEFKDLVGKFITGIEIVESHVGRDMQDFLDLEEWILSGIALQFKDERLEILNGLDCNTLCRGQSTDEKLRYLQVVM